MSRDRRYDSFKTWSGKLERQLTHLASAGDGVIGGAGASVGQNVAVPALFPVSAFGICLGMSSQEILWKTVATSTPMRFLHVTTKVNRVLWCAFCRAHVRHRGHLRLQGGLLLQGHPPMARSY
uniref:Uncharacterized protein n=1 Tax=Oryza glumipatula TaxID=40148 RepID=A0A0E0A632_9ORYZ